MSNPVAIRAALPSELSEVFSVDDDATQIYARAGIVLELTESNPFCVDERRRWSRSVEHGRLYFAVGDAGAPVGFASLDVVDEEPYLDQLSVRAGAARRGIGRALLRFAIEWGMRQGGSGLWLTTYGHVPFNRPFYESEGFVVMPEPTWGPGVRRHVEEQRRWLPAPEQRVAMRRSFAG